MVLNLFLKYHWVDSQPFTKYLAYGMKSPSTICKIQSLSLPELQPYRTLRRSVEHRKEGIFVAEGEKVVRRLLASDLTIVSLLLTPEWHEQLSSVDEMTAHHPPAIFIAEKKLLSTIVGYNLHQGIMAIAKVPAHRTLGEVIASLRSDHFLVALDGLVNAENVGVVVRNCAAFGVDALIVGETSSSPYLRRAVRNSMGTVFHLPVIHASNLPESLTILRHTYGTRIIGAHPHDQSTIYYCNFRGTVCIVLGNEGEGISKRILDVCTERIAIPMMNATDSINVASASAVFLYEAHKQRLAQLRT